MAKRRRRKTSLYRRLLIVFIELIVILNILRYAAFFKKDIDDGKIHLIVDNTEIEELEEDIYVDNNNIVYLSKDDVKNLLDKNIYEEKTEINTTKIISTCDNKIVTLVENENHVFINGVRTKIKGSLIYKDKICYLPISELQEIYNIQLNYIKDNKKVDIEFLYKEKETAQINKDINLKYKMTDFSKNIQKLEQGETVTIVEDKKGSWTRVKTEDGNIGYVRDKRLTNNKKVRDDLEKVKYGEIDVNSEEVLTVTNENFEEDINTLIVTSDKRKEIIDQIVDEVLTNEKKGVDISFNEISNTDNYYRLLIELKPYLEDYGICLIANKSENLNTEKLEKIVDIVK